MIYYHFFCQVLTPLWLRDECEEQRELLVLESDVQMLVAAGGKERTEAEYRSLLKTAGFELTRIIPVIMPYYVI